MAARVTVQDYVYFGSYWQILDQDPAAQISAWGEGMSMPA